MACMGVYPIRWQNFWHRPGTGWPMPEGGRPRGRCPDALCPAVLQRPPDLSTGKSPRRPRRAAQDAFERAPDPEMLLGGSGDQRREPLARDLSDGAGGNADRGQAGLDLARSLEIADPDDRHVPGHPKAAALRAVDH